MSESLASRNVKSNQRNMNTELTEVRPSPSRAGAKFPEYSQDCRVESPLLLRDIHAMTEKVVLRFLD